MKKFLSIILSITMIISVSALATPVGVNAVSKRTKAVRAYKKFLKQNKSYYKKFSLIYLDKDKIPELLVAKDDAVFSTMIYTYVGGKVTNTNTYCQLTYTNNKFKYYKKTGVFKSCDMGRGLYRTAYQRFSKGKVKEGLSKEIYELSGSSTKYYRWTEKIKKTKIKKSAYKKAFKKITKNKKIRSAKFYSNTKSGRKHCK